MRLFISAIALITAATPAWADNPAEPLTDEEVALVQQVALGCSRALEALRTDNHELAANCRLPEIPLEIARPLAEAGRMNGMARECKQEAWGNYTETVMRWARLEDTIEREAMHEAVYNAGHMLGVLSVRDGRTATACVEGHDFSMHYFANNIYPLIN